MGLIFCLVEFTDVVYARNNYYLTEKNTGIWKLSSTKFTEKLKPVVYINTHKMCGRSLRTAMPDKSALIVNFEMSDLLVIDLKKLDAKSRRNASNNSSKASGSSFCCMFTIENSSDEPIYDHQVFGQRMDKVITLAPSGRLEVFQISLTVKTYSILGSQKVKFLRNEEDQCIALAVCERSQHLIVHSMGSEGASQLFVYRILEQEKSVELSFKTVLDIADQRLSEFVAFSTYGYIQNHLILVAFTHEKNSLLLSYSYDQEKQVLQEVPKLRKATELCFGNRFEGVSGRLLCSDSFGRLAKIEYSG